MEMLGQVSCQEHDARKSADLARGGEYPIFLPIVLHQPGAIIAAKLKLGQHREKGAVLIRTSGIWN